MGTALKLSMYLAILITIGCSSGPPSSEIKLLSLQISSAQSSQIGGYEVTLGYDDTIEPTVDIRINNTPLGSNGRQVNSLGPHYISTVREITFGAYTRGDQAGISGNVIIATFPSKAADSITLKKFIVVDTYGKELATAKIDLITDYW